MLAMARNDLVFNDRWSSLIYLHHCDLFDGVCSRNGTFLDLSIKREHR